MSFQFLLQLFCVSSNHSCRLLLLYNVVGSFEQVYMDIAVTEDEIRTSSGGDGDASPTTSHIELSPTSMLSYIASLTPFSDFNQSPRNMYQCQVGDVIYPSIGITVLMCLLVYPIPYIQKS